VNSKPNQILIFGVFLSLVIGAAAWLLVLSPQSEKVREAEAAAVTAQDNADRAAAAVAEVKMRISTTYDDTVAALDGLYEQIPADVAQQEMFADLLAAAKAAKIPEVAVQSYNPSIPVVEGAGEEDVTLAQVDPALAPPPIGDPAIDPATGEPVDPATNPAAGDPNLSAVGPGHPAAPDQIGILAAQPLVATVTADYATLVTFLAEMEKRDRAYLFPTMALTLGGNEPEGDARIDMDRQIYAITVTGATFILSRLDPPPLPEGL